MHSEGPPPRTSQVIDTEAPLGRDSQTVHVEKSTTCGQCKKEITGEGIKVQWGELFHTTCFACKKCGKKFGNSQFYPKDNNAYCEYCYKQTFLPRCSRCRGEILGKHIKALNQDFHDKCFNCSVCKAPFQDGKYYEKNDNAYCHNDYNKLFGFSCGKCHQSISDGTAIFALDKYWHKNHLTCTKCNNPFTNDQYFEHQGLPYCQEHFNEMKGTLCGKCGKVIDGMGISALGKKWHQECFACSKCSKPVSGQAMMSEGNVFCGECAKDL